MSQPKPPAPHQHAHRAHHHRPFTDAATHALRFDNPARDAWQRPDDVLAALALTPAMTIADVGAGTGYFAVRLARAAPQGQVLATDAAPDMVRYLTARAAREKLPNLSASLATHATTALPAAQLDRILLVHLWHHVPDRIRLATQLATALKPGAKLFIVDFALDAERGPPPQHRLAPDAVIAELNQAGLSAHPAAALPGQYLIEATKPHP